MKLKELVNVLCATGTVIIKGPDPLELYEKFRNSTEALVWVSKHRTYLDWKVDIICVSPTTGYTFIDITEDK